MTPYILFTVIVSALIGVRLGVLAGTTTISGLRYSLYFWAGVFGLAAGGFVAMFAAVAGVGAIAWSLLPVGIAVGAVSAALANKFSH